MMETPGDTPLPALSLEVARLLARCRATARVTVVDDDLKAALLAAIPVLARLGALADAAIARRVEAAADVDDEDHRPTCGAGFAAAGLVGRCCLDPFHAGRHLYVVPGENGGAPDPVAFEAFKAAVRDVP